MCVRFWTSRSAHAKGNHDQKRDNAQRKVAAECKPPVLRLTTKVVQPDTDCCHERDDALHNLALNHRCNANDCERDIKGTHRGQFHACLMPFAVQIHFRIGCQNAFHEVHNFRQLFCRNRFKTTG